MRWEMQLERRTKNRLNAEITQRKLRTIAKVVEANPSLGFVAQVSKLREPRRDVDKTTSEEVYVYNAKLIVQNEIPQSEEVANHSLRRHILDNLQKQAADEGWTLHADRVSFQPLPTDVSVSIASFDNGQQNGPPRPPFELPELNPSTISKYFDGVYEREAHIRMIHDSTRAYVQSGGEQRSHVLLEGRPACAKTILMERFKEFYEQDTPDGVERVAFVDGPTMSKAGLENWMMQLALNNKLPEIICVEEIEKQNMDNLLTLLSVMGSGYIMKTNARIGRMKEMAKCVIWATCNDKQLLRKFRDGALWSRFTHKLHCQRPSRDLMAKIIMDKIRKTGGDPRWGDAVIRFAYEDIARITGKPIVDPRAIMGLLDGGDRLLDGSYQDDYIATLPPDESEDDEVICAQLRIDSDVQRFRSSTTSKVQVD